MATRFFLLSKLFLLSLVVTAQSTEVDFKRGHLARVSLLTGVQLEGMFHSANDSAVNFYLSPQRVKSIPVDSIQWIEIRSKDTRKKGTLIGAATGFCAGATIGWFDYDEEGESAISQTGRAAGGGLLGGFIGALGGTAIGALMERDSNRYYWQGDIRIYSYLKPKLFRYHYKGK